ncbi:MAG TPA: hypothetical protein VF054_06610 [Micromonosporaceae bacterium]
MAAPVTLPFPRQAPGQVAPSAVVDDLMSEIEYLDGYVSVGLGAQLRRDTSQSIPNNVQTYINFTVVEYDPFGLTNLAADNRIITPTADGIYIGVAYGMFGVGGGGNRFMSIDKNLDINQIWGSLEIPGSSTANAFLSVGCAGPVTAGTPLALRCLQGSGVALNFDNARLAVFRIALNT